MTSAAATVRELTAIARAHGVRVTGPAWMSMTRETEEERRRFNSAKGPLWRVELPVEGTTTAPVEPDGRVEVREFESREELSVFLPGAQSMAKYGTALSLMSTHPAGDMIINMSEIRLVLHPDGVETALGLRPLADFMGEEIPA
jgi:hypothetical protein